jgi:PIN domain nuclease of toxin-antitoxin system
MNHFDLLPIELRHATFVESLPFHHRDPFDRLLVAQSMLEATPVVSLDGAFDPYGVHRMW